MTKPYTNLDNILKECAEALGDPTITSLDQIATGIRDLVDEKQKADEALEHYKVKNMLKKQNSGYLKRVRVCQGFMVEADIWRVSDQSHVCSNLYANIFINSTWLMERKLKKAHKWADKTITMLEANESPPNYK